MVSEAGAFVKNLPFPKSFMHPAAMSLRAQGMDAVLTGTDPSGLVIPVAAVLRPGLVTTAQRNETGV